MRASRCSTRIRVCWKRTEAERNDCTISAPEAPNECSFKCTVAQFAIWKCTWIHLFFVSVSGARISRLIAAVLNRKRDTYCAIDFALCLRDEVWERCIGASLGDGTSFENRGPLTSRNLSSDTSFFFFFWAKWGVGYLFQWEGDIAGCEICIDQVFTSRPTHLCFFFFLSKMFFCCWFLFFFFFLNALRIMSIFHVWLSKHSKEDPRNHQSSLSKKTDVFISREPKRFVHMFHVSTRVLFA